MPVWISRCERMKCCVDTQHSTESERKKYPFFEMDILVLVKCPFSYSNFIKSNILIFLWWKNSKFKINFNINVMISSSVTWLMWKQCENCWFLFKFSVIQKFSSTKIRGKKIIDFSIFTFSLCLYFVVGFSFKKKSF